MEWLCNLVAHDAFRGVMIALGVIVAIVSVTTARNIARKKQVADMLFGSRGDQTLQDGIRVVRTLSGAPDKNMKMILDDAAHKEDMNLILYVLNHFETVCVGIKSGIYDEEMVKSAWCTMMISTYECADPVIQSMRKKNGKDTIFQEYELLVTRWKDQPLKRRKKF
ncbi:TPA: DUF4760 domain-containing protein [Stenotrophomonas maltophilia]|jgi:hypothetical protein|uniref:DUF4760 domain-containing protein n=1 Tax=Stenotrophomonas TaxID=40323 RepID=UPI001DCEC947|nr:MULTISPECIES: DUF4760 domain-containing protein [Stenotrophomonas]MBN4998536.1 DUF4760 domain-containing protein [Stenotrophomonas maltophilia]MBN5007451.1 DUF4760 domain-containing protein [Stenotrophomonas maltophilia]MBN5024696.1 DUF4760 domain-containing protein [Stenotrophomonas maltophilia]MDH1483632.1 DUF4760 domain-containing protein [Stenotrophomonas sp. GD03712]WON69572.1 DUF4760 domain-containing protein [Stenotrophomonas maltophilia]